MDKSLKALKALSDKTRLKIIKLLLNYNFCVGAIAKNLGISEAAVSQHLKVLRQAGIVVGEKRGYYTHYIINKEIIYNLSHELRSLVDDPPAVKISCHKKEKEGNKMVEEKCKKKDVKEPQKCSPEQIKECHGDQKHPCEDSKEN
ncbi:metalloregulator ArsR/SmtB family transcription factor [Proteinivorax tanatarense]|uniref:Metalloregulator ArsR/SmtB family transcription factor n=1 Tax=Proteinivorax tanatarense TaxID=1260629 RepID=A0AAU7VKW5_9FIRM